MPEPAAPGERRPPYSEEAERAVLGSALLQAERVMDLCSERGLKHSSFYIHGHAELFEALEEMHGESRPIDILTVGDYLKSKKKLDQVGGAGVLDELVDNTLAVAHAEYYIDIVYKKALLREIIDRSREAIEKCYDNEDDAETLLGNVEERIFELSGTQRKSFRPWSELIKSTVQEIDRLLGADQSFSGIPTGYADLDKMMMGLHKTDVIILAARPSMGKTSLALNIAEYVATKHKGDETPRPVGVFSLEMSAEQLVKRMLCCRARVPADRLMGGKFMSKDYHGRLIQAADELSQAPLYIDDTAGLEVNELRSRARRMKRKFDIQFIVVDYLQLLNHPKFASQGRQHEVAAISGALKAMAKELDVPVLVLSQLSRAPENRDRKARPKLSDLRDSGSIEQDADLVLLLRRPSRNPDDPDYEDKTLAIVDVAKHRNGPTGEVNMNFIEEYTRFETRADDKRFQEEENFVSQESGFES